MRGVLDGCEDRPDTQPSLRSESPPATMTLLPLAAARGMAENAEMAPASGPGRHPHAGRNDSRRHGRHRPRRMDPRRRPAHVDVAGAARHESEHRGVLAGHGWRRRPAVPAGGRPETGGRPCPDRGLDVNRGRHVVPIRHGCRSWDRSAALPRRDEPGWNGRRGTDVAAHDVVLCPARRRRLLDEQGASHRLPLVCRRPWPCPR